MCLGIVLEYNLTLKIVQSKIYKNKWFQIYLESINLHLSYKKYKEYKLILNIKNKSIYFIILRFINSIIGRTCHIKPLNDRGFLELFTKEILVDWI